MKILSETKKTRNVSWTITAEEAKRVEMHNDFSNFDKAVNCIEVKELSDEDLRKFWSICRYAAMHAEREMTRRGL